MNKFPARVDFATSVAKTRVRWSEGQKVRVRGSRVRVRQVGKAKNDKNISLMKLERIAKYDHGRLTPLKMYSTALFSKGLD